MKTTNPYSQVFSSKEFIQKYKKQDVRIRKLIDKALERFSKDPYDPSLNNHPLKRDLTGFRSINIGDSKNDYRALYKEIQEEDDIAAHFVNFGTYKELFQRE